MLCISSVFTDVYEGDTQFEAEKPVSHYCAHDNRLFLEKGGERVVMWLCRKNSGLYINSEICLAVVHFRNPRVTSLRVCPVLVARFTRTLESSSRACVRHVLQEHCGYNMG